MKNKINKWHIVLMSFVTLFITIFASLFSLRADPVDDETGEILIDNWELSTVFYDSTVDNGTTPLTEINWDASDGGHGKGTTRVITVQINYKNDSAVTTYQPGELEIKIPNLVYDTAFSTGYYNTSINRDAAGWDTKITLGANDSTHTNYDWTFKTGSAPSIYQQEFTFTNANIIEERANFEGSIQIIYEITPAEEVKDTRMNNSVEQYESACKHTHNMNLKAILNYNNETNEKITIETNTISFNYERTYTHPWRKAPYTVTKKASKISSLDGMGTDANDYIWVSYELKVRNDTASTFDRHNYPYIYLSTFYFEDPLFEGCKALSASNFEPLEIQGTTLTIPRSKMTVISNSNYAYAIVLIGYPKSTFNEENNNLLIENTVNLYGRYADEAESRFIASDSVSINLNDFKFNYSGNLYGLTKEFFKTTSESTKLYYDSLIGEDLDIGSKGQPEGRLFVQTVYTGPPLTVIFGDDLLYITDQNKNYRKLNDDEYYFSSITLPTLRNGNNKTIPENKYNCELWLRYSGETSYTLYEELTNQDKTWTFNKEDAVNGYYIKIKDMQEGLNIVANNKISITNAKNIAEEGRLYNFAFIQTYINNILQNEPTIDSYANFITKEEIANHDISIYNTYLQRSCSYIDYTKYIIPDLRKDIYTYYDYTDPIQDSIGEKFYGTAKTTLQGYQSGISDKSIEKYYKNMSDEQRIVGYELFELLPEGIDIASTEEEIINNINIPESSITNMIIHDSNWNEIPTSDFINLIKENINVKITRNWNNTNRTHLHLFIDLTEHPFILTRHKIQYNSSVTVLEMKYTYEISYDAYLTYGNTYEPLCYAKYYNRDGGKNGFNFSSSMYNDTTTDDGTKDAAARDINQNGNILEILLWNSDSITITSAVSTHQDVTTYVRTDKSNYSTGIVDVSNNSNYEYKLRVRTGAADVTNLIVYTNLEEAQPEKQRWKGFFKDVDISYAESKGYIVKPYYSENPAAGNLYNENGTLNSDWKEYILDTPEIVGNGLAITFDENFKTYNYSDCLYIYYYYNGRLYRSNQYYKTSLAGQTIEVPSTDFYIHWCSDDSNNNAYGFKISNIEPKTVTKTIGYTGYALPSIEITELNGNNYPETNHNPYNSNEQILWHYTYSDSLIIQEHQEHIDKTKVKSLAFEYLDNEGNPAILPANSLTYVLIQMKSPADENIKTLARMDCRTQWNAIDEFDRPVDFITGINSNVVKVALPNSIKEDSNPSISLKFIKEINGTSAEFENMKLDRAAQQTFMIRLTSLTANDDGSYNQLTALLKSNQELIISQIPVGTYLLEELGDNYFDFVEFTDNNDSEIIIEGVTFERTDAGYIITVSEDLTGNVEFNIKVTNEIEDERFYEDKDNEENLFLKNKIEEN